MDNSILEKISSDIAFNHRKIIDDWCKAYIAQIYMENGDMPNPGDFILNQQNLSFAQNEVGFKYWFEKKENADKSKTE